MNRYKINYQSWNKLAVAYQDKFMNLDLYDDTYDIFCQLIQKPNPEVLEIGCGPGNITKYLLTKRPDSKILAIDMAPNMIALAQINNPKAVCKIMDGRNIGKLNQKFDGIIAGFCLPYLSKDDCAKLIKDCSALLNNDGILYLSAIDDDYNKSGYETDSSGQNVLFVYYHQADYLLEELQKNKIDMVELIRKPYPKPNGTTATHLIIIARKNNPN